VLVGATPVAERKDEFVYGWEEGKATRKEGRYRQKYITNYRIKKDKKVGFHLSVTYIACTIFNNEKVG
jgi:hypothetical protein